jgi:hypothetical protein
MLDKGNVLNKLLAGLAAGDSLGSTTEFCTREHVLRAYAEHKAEGWPWRQVGGGPLGWPTLSNAAKTGIMAKIEASA